MYEGDILSLQFTRGGKTFTANFVCTDREKGHVLTEVVDDQNRPVNGMDWQAWRVYTACR